MTHRMSFRKQRADDTHAFIAALQPASGTAASDAAASTGP
jgi:hypothetical protein